MRISDWSSDVCSSDLRLIDAFQQARPQFPVQAERQIEHIATHDIYIPHDPSASPREPLSLLSLRLCANHSKGFEQSFDVVHRNHADRLDLARRAALDHRREHFATEFDELHDADILHRGDAFRSEEHTSELQSL